TFPSLRVKLTATERCGGKIDMLHAVMPKCEGRHLASGDVLLLPQHLSVYSAHSKKSGRSLKPPPPRTRSQTRLPATSPPRIPCLPAPPPDGWHLADGD